MPAPSAPVFQLLGSATAVSSSSATVAWPVHAINDVAFLLVEAAANNPTLSTANGFVQVGTVVSAAGSKFAVFWCRATSTAMASPVVTANTNHMYCRIVTFRGCITTGNPYSVSSSGFTDSIATGGTLKWPSVAVQQTNMLIAHFASSSADSASAWMNTAPTNAQLTGLAINLNAGTNTGNGGGLGVITGVKAIAANSAGNTATTAVEPTNVAVMTLALMPTSAWLDSSTSVAGVLPAAGTFTGVQGALTGSSSGWVGYWGIYGINPGISP